MKKIKIYLQYPWKASECSYYKYLLTEPPKEIEYITSKQEGGVIESKRKMMFYRNLKHLVKNTLKKLNLSFVNIKNVKNEEKYNLIHGAHCLIKGNKPWVADFEYVGQFTIPMSRKNKKRVKNKIINTIKEKNCKKILAWTNWTKEGILKEYPEIEDKIEVVYPGIPERNFKRKRHKGINLLFVSRFFYSKGGYHALEVMDRVTKKHKNINAILISQVPKEVRKKYEKNKKIKIYSLVPQKKLFEEIYPSADIFIYPGYVDSFGFPLTEAMSYGLPIVAADTNSRKEIVTNNKTGFVVPSPGVPEIIKNSIGQKEEKIIQNMIKKTEELIKNKNLRKKMSKNALREIKSGKFSIKERNKKLKEIYGEAIEK